MTVDLRKKSLELASIGELDFFGWRDTENNVMIDSVITLPGEQCTDDGHGDVLAARIGRSIEFVGPLTTTEIMKELQERQ